MEASIPLKPHVCFQFQVEKILGISNDGNYQVQWAPAWVSKFHLVGCEHLIQEFLQHQSYVKPGCEIHPEADKSRLKEDNQELEEEESDYQTSFQPQTLEVHIKEENTEPEIDDKNCKAKNEQFPVSNNVPSVSTHVLPEYHHYEYQSPRNGSSSVSSNNFNQPPIQPHDYSCIQEGKGAQMVETESVESRYGNECSTEYPSGNELHLQMPTQVHLKTLPQSYGHRYSCTICGYSCQKHSQLIKHIRTHTREKSYICYKCGKSFAWKADMTKHIRTHTESETYSCSNCGKTFSDKNNCIKHAQTCSSRETYFDDS